jgi:hypothetical protein
VTASVDAAETEARARVPQLGKTARRVPQVLVAVSVLVSVVRAETAN